MKKKIIILTGVIISGFSLLIQAQNNPFNLNYTPSTPNTAAVFKFTEYPVSISTGTMNVNVPVYNFSMNNLNLNISLDYQTQGVRVEEIASSVGLGWALNAGGMIMRQMRGLPDDYNSQGYMYLGNNQNPAGQEKQYSLNAKDSEEDIFNFSYPGGSGKFVLKASGDPVLFGQKKMIIQVNTTGSTGTYSNITGFIITDENGIKYTYDVLEITSTTLSSLLPSNFMYVSAWYLKKIENVFTGESIIFNYTASNVLYKTRNAQTLMHLVTSIVQNPAPYSLIDAWVGPNENPQYNEVKDFTTSGFKISSIDLPDNSKIQFQYTTQMRCDVGNDYALDQINILNSDNNTIKGFKLIHHYIDNIGVIYPFTSLVHNQSQYPYGKEDLRMRLSEVQELSSIFTTNPSYKFEYEDSYHLPGRSSPNQDHWGYYNGEKNNGSDVIVPKAVYHNSFGFQLIEGADRLPDPNSVKASALKKVIYPTGGYMQLDYEVNRAGDNKLIDSNMRQFTELIANPEGSSNTIQAFTINRLENNTPIKFKFKLLGTEIPQNNGCSIFLQIKTNDLSSTICSVTFDVSEVGIEKEFQLSSNLANGTYKAVWQINPTYCDGQSQAFNMRILWNQLEVNSDQYAGGLRIKKTTYSDGNPTSFPFVKEYKYLTDLGGSSGVVLRRPRYNMIQSEYIETSSGGQTANPSYFYNTTDGSLQALRWIATQIGNSNPGLIKQDIKNYLCRSSASNYPLTYSSGQNIMYTRVEIIQSSINGANNGKEVYYYKTYKDNSLYNNPNTFYASPPFLPVQVKEWELGLITKKQVYNNDFATLIVEEVNNYSIQSIPVDDQKNFKVAYTLMDITPGGGQGGGFYTINNFNIQDYFWEVGKSELTQTLKTSYNSNAQSMLQIINYSYDPSYFSLKKQSTLNSLGNTIEKRIYYPYDYTMGGVLQQMVTANIVGSPVSNETWKINGANEDLLDADAIEYKSVTGQFVPDKYFVLNTAAPINKNTIGIFNSTVLLRDPSKYKSDIIFENYDLKSNVLQLDAKGIKKSYLWDNPWVLQPIAEVVNATANNIAYSSFETSGKGNWVFSGTPQADIFAITGKKVYDPTQGQLTRQISTAGIYVVSYWSKSGQKSVNGTTAISGRSLNGWTYFEHKVTLGANGTVTVSGSGVIDELRLYPEKALMTSYCYTPLIGVTSQCDPNNRISYYEYDAFSRLVLIRDQDNNIIKKICYNYAGQAEECVPVTTYSNEIQNQPFTRNNCGGCSTGSQVTYTVQANTYTSTVSVAAANQLAVNDIAANGQNYANINGTCSSSSNVAITYSNVTGTTGFTALYTNTLTSQTYSFPIPTGSGTLGCIPEATYTLTITKPGNNILIFFGCGCKSSTGTSASFGKVNVSTTTCNTVTLDWAY